MNLNFDFIALDLVIFRLLLLIRLQLLRLKVRDFLQLWLLVDRSLVHRVSVEPMTGNVTWGLHILNIAQHFLFAYLKPLREGG